MKLGPSILLMTIAIPAFPVEVRLPPATRQTAPNGAILHVMPRRDIPLVVIRAVFKGGAEAVNPELAGLASVTAELLRRGSAKRTADQFATELDSLGADWDAGADEQSSYISLELLAKDFEAGLDLFFDALRQPKFPEDEVKKALERRIDGVRSAKDNPQAAAAQYFRSFYYGPKHPYGVVPDEASYGRITRTAIAAHHGQMYVGKNLILTVVGDIDSAQALERVKSLVEAMPAGQGYLWSKVDGAKQSASRLAIVNKPDATQTNFYIGQPGIARNSPDRVGVWIVNTLFGGRFTSLLNDQLRVNSGLTYGAFSRMDQNRLPGRLTIVSSTATDTTLKAVTMATSVLQTLNEKGIGAEQLASAKAYLKGTFPSEQLETGDQLAEVLSEIELYDLNRGEIDDLFSRIDAVTVEQANAIAKRYFQPGQLTFLLLGQADKWREEAKKLAPTMLEADISKPGFTIAAP